MPWIFDIADTPEGEAEHGHERVCHRALAEGKEISEVYGLRVAGLFDEFFYFLEELGSTNLLMGLDPGRAKRSSKRDILLKYGALLE